MAAFRNDSIFWVEVEKIVPNPYQPRREFNEGKLKELSESIRMYGVLQPLTVSRKEVSTEDGAFRSEYELIAGERRLRASKLAGLQQVPVLIRDGDDSEQEKLELAIIENLQREDLNAVDRALAFRQLADVFKLAHSQVAKKVGRSREYVSNTIRLLNLPEYMLQALREGDISEGHARTLLMLNDKPEEQDTIYREILLKKLSVREVEKLARKVAADKIRVHNEYDSDPELIAKEKEFTETLGTRVQIDKTNFGGKITIDYFSDEDLDNFLQLIKQSKGGMISPAAFGGAVAAMVAENKGDETIESNETAAEKLSAATPLSWTEERENILNDTVEEDVEMETATTDDFVETISDNPEPATEDNTPAVISNEAVVVVEESINTEIQPEVIEKPRSSLRERLAGLFGEPKPIKTTEAAPAVVESEPEIIADTVMPEVDVIEGIEVKIPEEKEDDIYNLKNFGI